MPIFKWTAIDLSGNASQGVDFAVSKTELSNLLLHRHLGLMYCRQLRQDFSNSKIKILQQLNFFHNLNALLLSGMPLPQALQILLNQSKDVSLVCIIGYVLYQVQEQGMNFGEALQKFTNVLGSLVVVILRAGFNVGQLPGALSHVCNYLENKLQMQRELRRAILMPTLTMLLFIIVSGLIFLVVVPQFAIIFENANIPLDSATQFILKLTVFLHSKQALIGLIVCALIALVLNLLIKTSLGKKIWHVILLHLPLIGSLIRYRDLFSFLQSAALLIEGGVPATEAFGLSIFSINNVILRKQTSHMVRLVEHGTSIQNAMRQSAIHFFTKDAIAMIAVGEESGCLGKMLIRTAEVYQQRYRNRLQLILSLVQPTLVICLGLLVALLIFAIYMPIFNMPAIIE